MQLSRDEKIELVELLEEQARRAALVKYLTVYESFYPWQRDFVAATKDYHEVCLCAANQIGKTYTGTDIDAMHLLGEYPDDWPGHIFEFPPMCWGLGYSMEKCRDLLQNAIFGKFINGEFAGGLVPKDRILSWESATGTPNAMRTVRVRHKSGVSQIQFWSYTQGQHAIMGDVVDWVHIDEEPKDQTIRPQVLTRTINGDKGKGGRIIYTFTPENGRTELVINFMDTPSKDQFFMMKGWVDAPHMTPEKMERLLAQYPKHQRAMRSRGEPMMGVGRIYDVGDELITCDPFDIPDHWLIINGMDFGWRHPQAHVQLAIDPDNNAVYVIKAYKAVETSPANAWQTVKEWGADVPVAWPQDGLQEKDATGQKKQPYVSAGFNMLAEQATWPPLPDPKQAGKMKTGGNSVEHGLYEILDLMNAGKFKIFTGCVEVLEETRQYHRDEKGKIVKTFDDLVDAVRYAYMMRRYAKRKGDLGFKPKVHIPQPLKPMSRR